MGGDEEEWSGSEAYSRLRTAFANGTMTDEGGRADYEHLVMSYLYALQEQSRDRFRGDRNYLRVGETTYVDASQAAYDLNEMDKRLVFEDDAPGEPFIPNTIDDHTDYLSTVFGDLENADMVDSRTVQGDTYIAPDPSYGDGNISLYQSEKIQNHTRPVCIKAARDVLFSENNTSLS